MQFKGFEEMMDYLKKLKFEQNVKIFSKAR
ncbi:UNVERIFIED_CONTAM: hypothetical protein BJ099_110162 [Lysinibacillus xylanilyticus]